MGEYINGRMVSNTPDLYGLDIAEHNTWQTFLDTALRVYATINRALVVEHHLTLNDVRLLDVLARSADGSARMGDLADELISLPSRVTRQIRRLETQNLVHRHSSPDDGRGVLATITDEGSQVFTAAMATYRRGVRDHFLAKLSRSQVTALGTSCHRVADALKADPTPARLGRV